MLKFLRQFRVVIALLIPEFKEIPPIIAVDVWRNQQYFRERSGGDFHVAKVGTVNRDGNGQ